MFAALVARCMHTMSRFSTLPLLVLLLAAIVLTAAVHRTQALTIKVQPHQESCFYEKVDKSNVKVILQFQVSSGGFLDIDATITSPRGNLIHSERRESEAKITFNADAKGVYKFCFSNAMSTMTSKVVSFEVHVGDLLDPHLERFDHMDPIEKSILRLNVGLGLVQNQQKYLRTRERDHRDSAERANAKVLWWSFFEIFLLVSVSFAQVYYLKRFLSR